LAGHQGDAAPFQAALEQIAPQRASKASKKNGKEKGRTMPKVRADKPRTIEGLLIGIPLGLAMWALIALPFI
jgi:hypothetical protein